ncbi:MAG: hypothetical protein AABW80_00755 [Nanoarchaeota archaeon]
MTLLINNKALECSSNKLFGKLLPKQLLDQINKFRERNKIVDNVCCEHCLKAHAIHKAQEMNLSQQLTRSILENLEGNLGHNGYYMDKEELVKI